MNAPSIQEDRPSSRTNPRTWLLPVVFCVTIFLSAALLFLVQLIFARLVLPLLGGAPSVWNTAMVFYQAVLLGGYAYAHFLTTRLTVRTQVLVHGAVLLLPLLFLPLAVPPDWRPPASANPVPWLLGLLALGVGVPFFAVSTSSPLLQKWFAATDHPRARDPYFLYIASNLGSLLGLLGYPFWLEPHASLHDQTRGWGWAYGGLVLLTLLGGAWAARRTVSRPVAEQATPLPGKISWRRRGSWVGHAFIPSSLLLSVTAYVSSDIAAVPLLWVLPLALYLLSFTLVFGQRPLFSPGLVRRLAVLALVPVAMVLAARLTTPMLLLLSLHVLAFFLIALVCHGDMAQDRPDARQLTEFYLWMSVGGVLGGAFNALLAPRLFSTVLEYPLLLVVAAFFCAPSAGPDQARSRADVGWPLLLAAGLGTGLFLLARKNLAPGPGVLLAAYGLPALVCFLFSKRPFRFALGLAALLGVAHFSPVGGAATLETARSFFGVHRVTMDAVQSTHWLMHGQTIHGMQSLAPERRTTPLTYYFPTGPLGQIFRQSGRTFSGPIGAVGLGAGAVAAYGQPGQELVFYEIDPVVEWLATDSRYFSYLNDSPARVRVELGDARLSLESAPDAHYEMLILDAYSSDSIPVHLLTREALQLYLRKLAPGGVLVFHVSNLHLNLRPVAGNLVRSEHLACYFQDDSDVGEAELAAGKTPSQWMIAARSEKDLGAIPGQFRWRRENGDPDLPLWTDDYSSLVQVLHW